MKKLSFTLLLFLPFLALAQPRFRAGAVLGLTASQIDGDLSAGYNKLGVQAGLRVISRLKGQQEASMEFLFSQRGCQNKLIPGDYEPNPFALTLNYVEVPLQWHYKDWLVEYEDEKLNFYRVSFGAGLSYARLINSKVDDETSWLNGVAPDYLTKNDLSLVLGLNFMVNRHFGFNFRWNRSLVLLYDSRTSPRGGRSWNQHCLYFQTAYLF